LFVISNPLPGGDQRQVEECIGSSCEFYNMLDTRKMVHIVSNGRLRNNPGPSGREAMIRQNKTSAMISGHYQLAMNNTMEPGAVTEALRGLLERMSLCVSTDSNHSKHGITN
jgi:ribonuclease HI